MEKIINDFKRISIKSNGDSPANCIMGDSEQIEKEDISLIAKGFYNGGISGVTNYKITDGTLIVECQRFKFFDVFFKRIKSQFAPDILNVNAIIECKDKNNEEHMLLIKRGNNVYAYKDYWDFPAGIVNYNEDLMSRLINRIENETSLKASVLKIEDEPFLLYIKKNFFGLYYKVKCGMSKEELEGFLNKKFRKGQMLLLKKTEAKDFLNKNKKVYPGFIGDIS